MLETSEFRPRSGWHPVHGPGSTVYFLLGRSSGDMITSSLPLVRGPGLKSGVLHLPFYLGGEPDLFLDPA